MLIGKIK